MTPLKNLEIERKFLILFPNLDLLHTIPDCKRVDISQTYLSSLDPNEEIRVRKKTVADKSKFIKTIKRDTKNSAERIEIEEKISEQDYQDLIKQIIPGSSAVNKTRFSIPTQDNNHILEIDIYPSSTQYAILEIELKSINEKFIVPDYITIVKELTGDKSYSNKNIALNNGKLPI